MKFYKDKQLLLSLLALGLFAGLSGRIFESVKFNSVPNQNPTTASVVLSSPTTPLPTSSTTPPAITLGFAGTIDLSKTISKKLSGDFSPLFANADFLKSPEITFASLSDSPETFTAIPEIQASGIDVVSIASSDKSTLERTLKGAADAGIKVCGAGMNMTEAAAPVIFSKDGYTVGFLCLSDVATVGIEATDSASGLLLVRDDSFDTTIKDAAGKVNALVVSLDFGVAPGTLFTPRQADLATRAIDDGAVAVVGTHPHAAQKVSDYNGAPIFYSLGDFISSQKFSKDTNAIFVTATLSGKNIFNIVSSNISLDKDFKPVFSIDN